MSSHSVDFDEKPSWKVQHMGGKDDHLLLTEGADHDSWKVMGVAEMGVKVRQSDGGLWPSVIGPLANRNAELGEAEPVPQERMIDAVLEVLDSLYC